MSTTASSVDRLIERCRKLEIENSDLHRQMARQRRCLEGERDALASRVRQLCRKLSDKENDTTLPFEHQQQQQQQQQQQHIITTEQQLASSQRIQKHQEQQAKSERKTVHRLGQELNKVKSLLASAETRAASRIRNKTKELTAQHVEDKNTIADLQSTNTHLRNRLRSAHSSLQSFVGEEGPWGNLHAKAKGVLDVATERLQGAEGYVSDALRSKEAAERRAAEVGVQLGNMRQTVETLNETVVGLHSQVTDSLLQKQQVHCKLHAVEFEYERARKAIKRLQAKLVSEQAARKEAQGLFRVEVLNHSFRKRDNTIAKSG